MSFIIKNLDNSRPNLQVGEVLDTELYTKFNSWLQYYDTLFPGISTIPSVTALGNVDARLSFRVTYYTDEYLESISANDDVKRRNDVCKSIYDLMFNEANRLYMPNYLLLFPELFLDNRPDFIDSFEFNIQATFGKKAGPAYHSSVIIKNTTQSGSISPPGSSGGMIFRSRKKAVEYNALVSLGIKYWGNVERSLNDAKNNDAYVMISDYPMITNEGSDNEFLAGREFAVVFAANSNNYNNRRGVFRNIVPSEVEHKNDLPDDENTYPGGGDDKNTYPEDDPSGQNSSGKGTFDNTNNPVDFPSMPLWDATSTGFISMWNPTISEISQLYGFLWDSDISTTLKKLFLEPMDAIISLAFFPVDPVNFPEKRNVTIGHVDTEITMYAVQKQFVDFDFGTIKLDEYYGAAWDYSPYTKVSIYLPYIGSQELDVDDVMNANLHLQYRIDLLSGMCVAMLKCTRDRDDLDAVVYTWQGNCAMQVPITAGSAREFINSIIQLGAMTGLALVQPAAGALAMGTGDFSMSADIMAMKNNFVNPTMATYAALNVLGQKVHVQRGGRVDANAGVMSPQSAYLIIDRPISAIPKGWNEYAGYPSLKIKVLSTQKGMTQVAYIKLNGLEATAEEISELDRILKAGVIL